MGEIGCHTLVEVLDALYPASTLDDGADDARDHHRSSCQLPTCAELLFVVNWIIRPLIMRGPPGS